MAESCISHNRHSESFRWENTKNCDLLIMNQLAYEPLSPVSFETRMSEFLQIVQNVVNGGGSTIVPIHSFGLILDLIERIHQHFSSLSMSIPIFFLSPIAEYVIAYADIAGEWLSKAKQDKVFLPEHPFIHEELIKVLFT
jgi:integrator complex subunit 9